MREWGPGTVLAEMVSDSFDFSWYLTPLISLTASSVDTTTRYLHAARRRADRGR